MYRTLREERQLVYSIGATSRPAFTYPGFGTFAAQAPTEPARAGALANEIHAMYAHFSKEGPTEAEVKVARGQIVNLIDDQLQRPDFWAAKLAVSEYRDQPPRDALDARDQYARAEPSAVHDAFRRYWTPDTTFTVIVTPSAAAVPAPAAK
jgi:predicted Zn-dependent peptidase